MVLSLAALEVRLELGEGLALQVEPSLSDWARVIARVELREEEETAPARIAELKQLLTKEEGLTVPLDDEFMTAALRPCHWNPESAAEKLKNYFYFKAKNPHIGRSLLPSRMEHVIRSGIMLILPKRDQYGRRILLLQTGKKWDPRKVPVDDVLRGAMMWLEIALSEPDTQVAGANLLWDMEGLSLSQVMRFTPSFAKMLLHFLQDCIPMRLKAIHFVKNSSIFDIGFKVFKPFIRDKLRSRIFFHGRDSASLGEHMDLNAVPTEYGGHMPMQSPMSEQILDCCTHFESYFKELSNYGYNTDRK